MIDRRSPLSAEPHGRLQSLEALFAIATAISNETVMRYKLLATLMEERDHSPSAATFREMQRNEERRLDMLARIARSLSVEEQVPSDVARLLPREMSEAWDAVQQSTLLTPYRALAVAVTNAELAFAHYSYLAANAEKEAVARQAEALARDELAHAAELRVQRRLTYRFESCSAPRALGRTARKLADFRALNRRLMSSAASVHRSTAAGLAGVGDTEGAALVAALAEREETIAGATPSPATFRPGEAPSALLLEALAPLERASEIFEDVVASASDEALLHEAQAALEGVVEGISLVAAHLGRRPPPRAA